MMHSFCTAAEYETDGLDSRPGRCVLRREVHHYLVPTINEVVLIE